MVEVKARQQAVLHMMVIGLWASLMALVKNKSQVAWSTQESLPQAFIMGRAKWSSLIVALLKEILPRAYLKDTVNSRVQITRFTKAALSVVNAKDKVN